MATKRKIDIYSAGCPACEEAIEMVNDIACGSCEIEVHDMRQDDVAERAAGLGVRSVPAVVVNGKLLGCCQGGPNEDVLRDSGIGSPTT